MHSKNWTPFVYFILLYCIYVFYFYILVFSFQKPTFVVFRFSKAFLITTNKLRKQLLNFIQKVFALNQTALLKQRGALTLFDCCRNTTRELFRKKDWTRAFSKTFNFCCGDQDFIPTHFEFFKRRDFRSILKLLHQIWRLHKVIKSKLKMPFKIIPLWGLPPIFNDVK